MAATNYGRMARYAAAGMNFAFSPAVGAFIGHYLDLYFKTDPILTIILCLGGFVGGTINLIRELSVLQKQQKEP